MIILSDIIMHDYTSDDIIINGLAHYWDITSEDFAKLYMYLKSGAPSVISDIALGVSGAITLKTTVSDNIYTSVKLYPMICKLASFDDKFLYELDPFPLSELDYYMVGTRLVSEVDCVHGQALIKDSAEQETRLQSTSIDIELLSLVSRYDEYLVMHFDKYIMSEMDGKIIL